MTLAILVGSCGFWLFCFNRANATGLPRKATKKIEKIFIVLCFLIPSLISFAEWPALTEWMLTSENRTWWPRQAPLFNTYGAWCLASAFVLGTLWLESRLWLIPPDNLEKQSHVRLDAHSQVPGGSPGDKFTKFLFRIPGNEVGKLAVTKKQLRLARKIDGVDGLRIGHISDLHFTGQYQPAHYHFVLDRLLELDADLIVIAGDIIDKSKCLPWIEPILGKLTAPLGCFFVLGNHDLRISEISEVTQRLMAAGLFDLGSANHSIELATTKSKIELLGNELPWLDRNQQPNSNPPFSEPPASDVLRLGVSHSPDQIRWARRHNIDLMLAGHTHGGQVRFPGVGPIVAPSMNGSKFASGVFHLPPTLMHVSRGIAGTHPLRWRCTPEITLLTIRTN